jgi:thiamine-phosphate pyrophosphorylase
MLVTAPAPNLAEIVGAAVRGGVNAVQVRAPGAPDGEKVAMVRAVRSAAKGALLLVNGICRFAATAGADGTHLPEAGANIASARNLMGGGLVGRSVHSVSSAIGAARDGADYIVAGTVFASLSHPGASASGVDYLLRICTAVAPLPVIAIGGITPETVGGCIAVGAAGVAVLSPIMSAADPETVARRFREELNLAWNLRSTENR